MNRIFIDLDGVVVDFELFMTTSGLTPFQVKTLLGAYLAMKPIDGALQAVRELISLGFDVWIATKPPTGIAHAYSDKAAWVFNNLAELSHKLIITHDKGLLGDTQDYLCDDRPEKANCEEFSGQLIRFTDGYHWKEAMEFFRAEAAQRGISHIKDTDVEMK